LGAVPPFPPSPPLPNIPSVPPRSIVVPATPPEKSVDDLLAELERVQAQKAGLDKQELELKTTLRKKLDQQAERLNKLGVPLKAAQPDRGGRIIIEGNTAQGHP
jgi:hypothetical protein